MKDEKLSTRNKCPHCGGEMLPPGAKAHRLDEVDMEMIRLKLERPAITIAEMAEAVGLKFRATAERSLNPRFKAAIREYQKKAIQIIIDAKEKAARKIVTHIDSDNKIVSLRASEDVVADILPAKRFSHKHEGEIDLKESKSELERRIAKIAAARQVQGSPESN